ncbi:MAG: M1 family metallopeptidase [Acidobacteria bacterium]|nr:M1 family metallopeptidase [Acidobacteriota bacterium]
MFASRACEARSRRQEESRGAHVNTVRDPTWIVLLILVASAALSQAWAADYKLEARLDPAARTVSGSAHIRWSNKTTFAASDLQFHLYYNAWLNPQSSFLNSNRMREEALKQWRPNEWAAIDVSRLKILPGNGFAELDLTSAIQYIQPDDGNPHDRTVMKVILPRPVKPGETIEIQVEFKIKVPRPFARTGSRGEYFFIAQWFPKLGVFEKTGAWNCRQFIQTEFFSEFGTYDVRLVVPGGWIVGATGRQQSHRQNKDGTATHHFYQEQVIDFAWVASPDFYEFRDRFEHPHLKAVDLRLLLMLDHLGQESRYFTAAKTALKYFGEWLGEYPYGHLTIIDPAYLSNSGGMEYPTLITGGTRWLNLPGSQVPEEVTVHETGHQFFYAVVANNEFEDAWLDEGLTEYSTRKIMREAFGSAPVVRRYFEGFIPLLFEGIFQSDHPASGLGTFESELKLDVMATPAWQYGPAARRGRSADATGLTRVYGPGAYTVNSYTKPDLMLITLERHLGWGKFRSILQTYFSRWRFKHPRAEDFFNVVHEVAGEDFSWFWNQTYRSSHVFDYSVDAVTDLGNGLQSVHLRRWGEGVFPVEVRVEFSDATVVREIWDGQSRWTRFDFRKKSPIRLVEVDPDGKLALDVNYTNNSWVRKPASKSAARKWALKWAIWLQNLLEHFAFFS